MLLLVVVDNDTNKNCKKTQFYHCNFYIELKIDTNLFVHNGYMFKSCDIVFEFDKNILVVKICIYFISMSC